MWARGEERGEAQGRVAATVRFLIDRSLVSEFPHNKARITDHQKYSLLNFQPFAANVRAVGNVRGSTGKHDPPVPHDVQTVRYLQRNSQLLLN